MIPTLATERLTLRAPRLADFEPFAVHCASPRAMFENGPLDRDQPGASSLPPSGCG
jgi:ribosomal-protein-alanine N-acetyltransferase